MNLLKVLSNSYTYNIIKIDEFIKNLSFLVTRAYGVMGFDKSKLDFKTIFQ